MEDFRRSKKQGGENWICELLQPLLQLFLPWKYLCLVLRSLVRIQNSRLGQFCFLLSHQLDWQSFVTILLEIPRSARLFLVLWNNKMKLFNIQHIELGKVRIVQISESEE